MSAQCACNTVYVACMAILIVAQKDSLLVMGSEQFELGSGEMSQVAADADDACVCKYDQQGQKYDV